jgi:hypothetical protein
MSSGSQAVVNIVTQPKRSMQNFTTAEQALAIQQRHGAQA